MKVWKVPQIPNLLFIILFGTSIALLEYVYQKYLNFYKGDIGEKVVDRILTSIPNIKVYRDINLPENFWNIDHVVVTGNEIYAIETKNYEGKITCHEDNWDRTLDNIKGKIPSFSSQAKANAAQLKNYLATKINYEHFFVKPIVVLAAPFDPKDINCTIEVLSPNELHQYFQSKTKNPQNQWISQATEVLNKI